MLMCRAAVHDAARHEPGDMMCCRRNEAGDQRQTLQRLKENKQERMTTEDGKSRFKKLKHVVCIRGSESERIRKVRGERAWQRKRQNQKLW